MTNFSTLQLLLASFIGFAFFMMMSWQEWQKLTGIRHSLWSYIVNDQPGFYAAVLLTAGSYIALPELAQIEWFRTTLGFAPQRTPLGAMAAAFVSCVIGYQLRAFFLRRAQQ